MLNLVRIWVVLSSLLVASGWILSAFHQLNRVGYGIVFALAGIASAIWLAMHRLDFQQSWRVLFQKLRVRFKRPLPFLFLVLVLMTLAGGLLYPQTNGDANSYRTPRILHWLAAGQWHWIRTYDVRMNIVSSGFEWLSAPLILFTRTDHYIFLINWVSLLMLPGLIFSVFTRVGVRPLVAWWWAWLLAGGWVFVLQAETGANDSFAAVYALAAVDLALRARETQSHRDLWLSFLAVALAAGAKQTNVPLILLWLIAAWPSLKCCFAANIPRAQSASRLALSFPGFLVTLIVMAAGALVSTLPTVYLNFRHAGSWLGIARGTPGWRLELDSPFWGIVGNAFAIPTQNLVPPYFPWADRWNAMMDHFRQTPFGSHFSSFEAFGYLSVGIHGVDDGNAGLGLGLTIVTAISILAAWRYSGFFPRAAAPPDLRWWLRLAPWGLLLVFMAKVGAYTSARHLTPYYVFLFPAFLVSSGHLLLVRRHWWRGLGLAAMVLTVFMVVVSRGHPLFPVQTVLDFMRAKHPDSRFVTRATFAFGAGSTIGAQVEAVKQQLPQDERIIGFASTLGSCEKQFWLPIGSRRVQWVLANDTGQQLRAEGIHYVVVEGRFLKMKNETIEAYGLELDAEIAGGFSRQFRFGQESDPIFLLRLR